MNVKLNKGHLSWLIRASGILNRYRLSPIILFGAFFVFSGCQSNPSTTASKKGSVALDHGPAVTLPPPPSFKEKAHAPINYPDGSNSVYGVQKNMKFNIGKDISATGTITSIYQCPKCAKKNKEECPVCRRPHFFLADDEASEEKAILVADYSKKFARSKSFRIGSRINVSGSFSKSTGDGFSSSYGVLVFKSAGAAAY